MLLARLSSPRVLGTDLTLLFGQHGSRISRFVNKMLVHLYVNFRHLLGFDKQRLQANLVPYSRAVGLALGMDADHVHLCKCWGFVDGTFRRVCRPEERQDLLYNGHYGGHGFKYLIISSPCGLVEYVFGPIAGRHHDAWLVDSAGLVDELASFSFVEDAGERVPYYIYGDSAFPRSEYIEKPCTSAVLTLEEMDSNTRWSGVRVSVENAIGGIANTWQAIDFKRQEKYGLTAVALRYKAAVILYNALQCARGGNQISERFLVDPPTLEEYMRPPPEGVIPLL
jgi:hypothetical protein